MFHLSKGLLALKECHRWECSCSWLLSSSHRGWFHPLVRARVFKVAASQQIVRLPRTSRPVPKRQSVYTLNYNQLDVMYL